MLTPKKHQKRKPRRVKELQQRPYDGLWEVVQKRYVLTVPNGEERPLYHAPQWVTVFVSDNKKSAWAVLDSLPKYVEP